MVNFQKKKLIPVIGIMVMIAASPLSVTYVQAEMFEQETLDEINFCPIPSKSSEGFENLKKTIVTERIVDGKLKVKSFESVQNELSEEEMRKFLMVDAKTNNWVIVKNNSYNSGIILYDGKISNPEEPESPQSNSPDDLHYRVIISGNRYSKLYDSSSAQPLVNSGLKIPKFEQAFSFVQLDSGIPKSPV